MSDNWKEGLAKFGGELLEEIRATVRDHEDAAVDDAVIEEHMLGIEKTILAMREAGVEEAVIIQMLQKYWDLRLSEAKELLATTTDDEG
ncbi:MAG: hypothetical protein LUH57_03815 [Ruminococcus sp.]|nr:hypothetical protein [Ruminococcus sp.]